MNLLQKYKAKQLALLSKETPMPNFKAGDTVKVHVKIVEGTTERIQVYEGLVLRRKHRGLDSTFMVKKVSNGESVERSFPLYSPRIDKIEVLRRGRVRRSRLYYMRELTGKAARIKEENSWQTAAKESK